MGDKLMAEQLNPPRSGASTKNERHQFWQEVIQLQKKSNLRQRDFCEKYGLKRSDFSRWHHRLNKTLKKSINNAPVISTVSANKPPEFIELRPSQPKSAHRIEDNQPDTVDENFILRLKNGAEIIIPNEFNQHTLSKIILTLEAKL